MTREEASKIFRKEIECMSHSKCEDCILEKVCEPMRTTPLDSEYIEAFEMAINALEQEPSGDLISRAEAQTALMISKDAYLYIGHPTIRISDAVQAIRELPPVNPQEKVGHWIRTYGNVKCSVCGSVKDSREVGKATHYCDFCGANMVEPQEGEEE